MLVYASMCMIICQIFETKLQRLQRQLGTRTRRENNWRPRETVGDWGDYGDKRKQLETEGDSGGLGRLLTPWGPGNKEREDWETEGDCGGLGRLQRTWGPGEM